MGGPSGPNSHEPANQPGAAVVARASLDGVRSGQYRLEATRAFLHRTVAPRQAVPVPDPASPAPAFPR